MNKAEKLARAARARALLFGGADETPPAQPKPAPAQAKGASASSKGTTARAGKSTKASERRSASPSPETVRGAPRSIDPPHPPPPAPRIDLSPRIWRDPPPKRGDLVFYRGERFWVERVDINDVDDGKPTWIRISDHKVPTDPTRALHDKRLSFYTHLDSLTPIPADYAKHATRLPTVASVARAERAKTGARDVGDEIANLLRKCMDLEAVYSAAAKYLTEDIAALRDRYGHLNHGQQRMNLGNRMRAKWRKEHL